MLVARLSRVVAISICGVVVAYTALVNSNTAQAQPVLNLSPSGGGLATAQFEYIPTDGGTIKIFRTKGAGYGAVPTVPQFVSVDFAGNISGFSDIPSGALFALEGVATEGSFYASASLLVQETSGGTFSVWSDSNKTELLLTGNIHQGQLFKETGDTITARFEASGVTITGGSLMS